MYPQELKYSKEHEWAKIEDNQVTLGITYFAQHQLGDVVFVELPMEGDSFKKGEGFGVVESVKAVSDLYAPVSGEVVKVNEKLLEAPELVNEDPYGDGWMIVLKVNDTGELDAMMDAAAYETFVKEEE
ncbi:glycine cleavage system protein GcvH [Metallumcola ferriviriculae]|uniref:Glycine cleavage system H protein n=1 Tax=Metallumcola ferriviriculae TaxID=3039180 RepID=A0AAU0ULN7_9FIRM|nr:glycine cleavage system protein GcvH [Desulfitibacteraceae bacterium MK1]